MVLALMRARSLSLSLFFHAYPNQERIREGEKKKTAAEGATPVSQQKKVRLVSRSAGHLNSVRMSCYCVITPARASPVAKR